VSELRSTYFQPNQPPLIRGGAGSALPLIRGSRRGWGTYFKLHLAGSIATENTEIIEEKKLLSRNCESPFG
jgi:hypothetical protein